MLVLGVCIACGRKAPPLPPIVRMADPTRDLQVVQAEWLAELRWSYPQTTTDGGALPDLEKIEVLRVEIPRAQEPPAGTDRDRQARRSLFEAQALTIGELEDDSLALATRGAMLHFTEDVSVWAETPGEGEDEVAGPDVVLWYAVRTQCCGKRMSELSNIVRCVPAEPLPAPEGLEITPEKDGLYLRWAEVEDQLVQIERSADGKVFEVVTPEPQGEKLWIDRTATQDREWSYRLRAVGENAAGESVRIGFASPVVRVDYPDRYPPDTPTELVCLPEGGRVRLRWRAAEGAERYVVERRGSAGTIKLLADDVRSPHYLDTSPPPNGATYLVRAVDNSENLSEAVLCEASPGGGP